MRWTQIRRFFVAGGLSTALYGLVIIGRMTAGASVSLWGINPTAITPAPAAPTPPAATPAPAPPAPAPAPPTTTQIVPAPAPLAPSAPAPASSDEALERAYKGKLLTEGENP